MQDIFFSSLDTSPLGVVTIFFSRKARRFQPWLKMIQRGKLVFIFLHFQGKMESTDSIHEYLKPGVWYACYSNEWIILT